MKLHFEPNLDYQCDAIDAVCDLFRGQEICRTEFTVTRDPADAQMRLGFAQNDLGLGNRLTLLDDDLLANLQAVQIRNGLAPSEALASGDFTVEMETGTGKTYVYLRTIFELNERYGFTKFVIVVPSIAIKEGVHKSLQITDDHFKGLYAGVPFDYFVYDSAKLGQVRTFATSAQIQIMVVTVGAINRFGSEEAAEGQDARERPTSNVMYRPNEKTGDEKPIDLIRATHPIVIVDEPQSVDGGLDGQGRRAIARMNPLCTLRYSATHADKHHMVYRLDAVDAYERRLVKQIEVAAATVEEAHNRPYVRFLGTVMRGKRVFGAEIELDVQRGTRVRRETTTVQPLDNLEQTTGREIYRDVIVGQEIRAKGRKAEALLELRAPGGEVYLRPGEAWGDVDALAVQREMIRRTIREHLDKEKRLRPQGIKVLSLFFIDEVARYRRYDADGNAVPGDYARIFEEEYRRLANHPDYRTLFAEVDLSRAAEEVHEGYFSIDRKSKRLVDTQEGNEAGRAAAEEAYNLIMRDKEKLLSFATPLKFIFSHSALREGWDNPNVFQICSLRDMRSERERRQTIGRGLRLCVNQEGHRLRGFEVNTLTVVATESYEEFAENLQKEIEAETGFRFGVVEEHQFAAVAVTAADGSTAPLGIEPSKALWQHLKSEGYIDATGKVQDALRSALKADDVKLPEAFRAQANQITQLLHKIAGKLEVKNADERRPVRPRQAVLHSPDFRALWDRIKHRTTYRVEFDNEKLIEDCTSALRDAPPIPKTRLQWRKADLAIGKAGVEATERDGAQTVVLEETDVELPDLLTQLQDRTQLTRRTIHRVVTGSRRLDDFKRNPQAFIEIAAEAINRRKQLAVVDGIKYQRLGDQHYYAQELFEQKELSGYLRNMLETKKEKSVYVQVVYDSGPEADFANGLERNDAVKVYAKLPGWFTVPTPLGDYNPDWAVLVEKDGAERLYLVVETKSSWLPEDLRPKERAKIECGKAHFAALRVGEAPAEYRIAQKVEDILT